MEGITAFKMGLNFIFCQDFRGNRISLIWIQSTLVRLNYCSTLWIQGTIQTILYRSNCTRGFSNKIRTSCIFTKRCFIMVSSSFPVNQNEQQAWWRDWGLSKYILYVSADVRGAGDLVLRLGWNLGFGVRSRIRARVGVRCGIWNRIRVGRCRGRGNIASSLVPLHVPYTSDGLDHRCSGSPVVPVLEFSMLENILSPSVAWIHVSHPPAEQQEQPCLKSLEHRWSLQDENAHN